MRSVTFRWITVYDEEPEAAPAIGALALAVMGALGIEGIAETSVQADGIAVSLEFRDTSREVIDQTISKLRHVLRTCDFHVKYDLEVAR